MVGGQLIVEWIGTTWWHAGSKHNISPTAHSTQQDRGLWAVGRGDKEGGRRGVAAERRRHGICELE
jgi:hypothetical protein